MARWRDTKQGKSPKPKPEKNRPKITHNYSNTPDKVKAFLTDTFMITMPIMYIVIYLVMGSLENAGADKLTSWGYILITLGVVVVGFYTISGQTPGLKAYNLKVIDINTKQKP